MTDKDDFDFSFDDEPIKGADPAAEEEEKALRQSLSAAAAPPARGGRRRTLLLLLLLVALAAAGSFFYFGAPESPAPPPPAPSVVKKQPIAPPPPAEPPVAQQAAKMPAPPPQAASPAAAPATATATVATAVEPKGPSVAAPAPSGPFTLRAGAYLLKENLRSAERIVRRLGYEPRVTRTRREVTMTRLRLGLFPPAEADARLRELKALAPDAFTLQAGEQVAVYAASYHDLDQARRFADRLYAQGVRVLEEPVQAELPVSLLSFGDFPDRKTAEATAARATKAGLEVYVGRKR
jgi:hypothetical protein